MRSGAVFGEARPRDLLYKNRKEKEKWENPKNRT